MSLWFVESDEVGDMSYIRIQHQDKPGYIQIKAETEGFVVDVFPDAGNESDSTCYSFYTDLADEEE